VDDDGDVGRFGDLKWTTPEPPGGSKTYTRVMMELSRGLKTYRRATMEPLRGLKT
jgi:hypothetical protein